MFGPLTGGFRSMRVKSTTVGAGGSAAGVGSSAQTLLTGLFLPAGSSATRLSCLPASVDCLWVDPHARP